MLRLAGAVRRGARGLGPGLRVALDLEKLVQPYKACTAHAWIVAAPPAYFDWDEGARRGWLDAHVAAGFDARLPSSRGFAPLPVLGVPGWWPANRDPRFYEDAQVFRPGRRQPA